MTTPNNLDPLNTGYDYTIFGVSDNTKVPMLRAYQEMVPEKVEGNLTSGVMSSFSGLSNWRQEFVEWKNSISNELQRTSAALEKAQQDIADGIDPGEISALFDAHAEKWSALISKNTADIAQMGTTIAGATADAVSQSVAAVTDGINQVAQGIGGVVSDVADAFTDAFARLVHTLTGKNLGYWDAEVYTASSTVYPGFNDTPLGICKHFDGRITDVIVRCTSAVAIEDIQPSMTLGIYINGNEKGELTMSGEGVKMGSITNQKIELQRNDVITLQVKNVTGEYIGMSVMLAGVYL